MKFAAENQLLLCCGRTTAAPQVVARLRALAANEIDWDYLFLLSRRHALLPLLYRQLDQHASDLIPEHHLKKLKQHFLENAARNTILSAELCRLIDLFSESQIETISYKGPTLALFAYDNLALRRFVDLDVIVKKSDVLKAREILLSEGYTPTKSLSLSRQELLLRTQHNMQFSRDNRHLMVELHWEVAPHLFASSVVPDKFWQDLVTVDLTGTKVKSLSADDLLFSLCVHGSRHLWERLSWICDVAELVARHRFNWTSLLKRAETADNERMFLLGLFLAEKLLDAPLPEQVKARCRADERLESLATDVIEHLFNGTTHVPATSREIFNYNIRVRKTLTARARYLLHMFRPTDSDLSTRSLPPGLSFAYYVLRPFRLLSRISDPKI